ncbi:MAG: 1-acyl-sn-glycerol-3-phosphate acyltransferase [Saprospiraceae bacterium]|nr:1-acyl-sn-glycerol-3-phosphate acyltransferase [Saprospiraceae bacterium]
MMGHLLAFIRMLLIILWIIIIVGIGAPPFLLGLTSVKIGFQLRAIFCKVAIQILGLKIIKTGNSKLQEGTLYVGNHRSLVDPIVVFSEVQSAYAVSKAEIEAYPLIGAGAKMSGVIFVDRQNKDSRNSARSSIVEAMQKKFSIVLFPEGTISRTKKTLSFKKGAFEAAIETNTPIIPFAMEYHNPSKDFWLHDNILIQFLKTFSKWRTVISIHYFEPIINTNDALATTLFCENIINEKISTFQQNHWTKQDLIDTK